MSKEDVTDILNCILWENCQYLKPIALDIISTNSNRNIRIKKNENTKNKGRIRSSIMPPSVPSYSLENIGQIIFNFKTVTLRFSRKRGSE